MITQSDLLTILALATVVVGAVMVWAIWKLLKTVEKLASQVEKSLGEFEKAAEEIRKTSAILQEIMIHAERSAANVEHMTEGVRRFRRTLDAATGVLEFAAFPILGNVAGALAGSKAVVSYVVNRIFGKEGRHGA